MKKTQKTLRIKDSIKEGILYIAFELSHRRWKLAFSNGEKMRTVLTRQIIIAKKIYL
jgi:alpha-D-ribose 1-methylphosphonate 5-triphosphate synthase subunit PhnL